MSYSYTSVNDNYTIPYLRGFLGHFRHMGQLAKQFPVQLSLLCGLRTGEVDQSCLTDALGVSP